MWKPTKHIWRAYKPIVSAPHVARQVPYKCERKGLAVRFGRVPGRAWRQIRTFHVEHATAENVRDVIVRNVSRKSVLHTDESNLYTAGRKEFARLTRAVKPLSQGICSWRCAYQYCRGLLFVFKRGMKGVLSALRRATFIAILMNLIPNRSGLGVEDTERTAKIIQQAASA